MRLWKTVLLIFSLSPALAAAESSAPHVGMAQKMLESCLDRGSVATVRALWSYYDGDLSLVTDGIASGDTGWLTASACLAHGVHFSGIDHASLAFDIAWAEALSKKPASVFALVGGYGISLHSACSFPFIEPEDEFRKIYVTQTLAALDEIKDPYLQQDKEICKLLLQTVYEQTRKQ